MQKAIVMEKVEPQVSYTATLTLTNSKKVGFTRRDLALCFFPKQVVEKADRHYEVIKVDGTVLPFDNPKMVRRLWEIVQKKYIYDGTVKKDGRHNFDWAKIARRLERKHNISIHTSPARHTIISQVAITTNTPDFNKHRQIVTHLREQLQTNAPHLTFQVDCSRNSKDTCPI